MDVDDEGKKIPQSIKTLRNRKLYNIYIGYIPLFIQSRSNSSLYIGCILYIDLTNNTRVYTNNGNDSIVIARTEFKRAHR